MPAGYSLFFCGNFKIGEEGAGIRFVCLRLSSLIQRIIMKQRAKDYFERQKSFRAMQRIGDLKSLLIAEHDASRNLIVKKDIRDMLEKLESVDAVVAKG